MYCCHLKKVIFLKCYFINFFSIVIDSITIDSISILIKIKNGFEDEPVLRLRYNSPIAKSIPLNTPMAMYVEYLSIDGKS